MTFEARRSFAWLVAGLLLLAPAAALAQSNAVTGQILGTVTDPDGGVLPGTTIEATNVDTGLVRRAIADASGFYRIDLLPSGTYDVKATMDGFKTEIQKGVRVTLGSAIRVDFKLSLSAVKEEIVVTAQAPVVETSNPSIAAEVSSEQIANLPLNGRDFTDFIALTPGAIPDSVGRTHIGGMRGIQNSFNIDGANDQSTFFGEERGGTRPPFTFSQAAIKEFQVITSSYSVQFGNASGGIINAITKSGTNEFKGEAWYYYRDESFVGDDALGNPSTDFDQQQFGAAIGGPIIKDKLHYFVSYDGQRFTTPTYRTFYNFPTDHVAEWEAITGLSYDREVGKVDQTNDQDVFLAKIDWQLNENNILTFRDNYSDNEGENLTNSYRTSGRSNNGLEENKFNSAVLTWNSVFSENVFNEAILQYSKEERPRTANVTSIPEVQIGRTYEGVFGQNNFLPNWLDEERWQFIDNLTWYVGDHTLKFGVNLDMVEYDDGFFRYGGGHYFYADWDAFFAGEPDYYTQAFSDYNGAVKFDTGFYSGFVQDEWRSSPNFTLTFGLRYDLQDHDDPKETNPLFPQTGEIPDDTDNIAPRVGFAWDVAGDGKQVLRGGIGYFFDRSPTLLDANAMLANGVRVVRMTVYCDSGDCPAFPDRITDPSGMSGGRPDIYVFAPNYENPETLRMSIGYEREVARDFSIGVDLIYSETEKLERKQDLNLAPDGGETVDGRPTYQTRANYPDFNKIIQFTSDARANYKALVLKARKRFSHGWMFDASYTYSRARDNDSNERSVSSRSSFPEDQYNIDGEWGPSAFDVKHKFVLSSTVDLGLGFTWSTIVSIHSGFPFTATQYYDANHDRYYNDRATVQLPDGTWYHYRRNSFRQPWYHNVDMRLSKMFALGGDFELELIAEVFNLFDNENWRTSRTQLIDRYGNIRDDFGKKTDPGDPRQFQVGVKFRF